MSMELPPKLLRTGETPLCRASCTLRRSSSSKEGTLYLTNQGLIFLLEGTQQVGNPSVLRLGAIMGESLTFSLWIREEEENKDGCLCTGVSCVLV